MGPKPHGLRGCIRTQPCPPALTVNLLPLPGARTFTEQRSLQGSLKRYAFAFFFLFSFIKSSSQPNLFYAICCGLSSRATYSVCLPDVPHMQPLLLRSCHLGCGLGCLISVCLELSIKREAVSEADDGSGPQKATYGPGCLLPQEQSRFQQALLKPGFSRLSLMRRTHPLSS